MRKIKNKKGGEKKMAIFKNHSMLREIREGKKENKPVPAGHVCAVVLEELARESKGISLEEFLGAWNKFLGGNWYARIERTELQEEVYTVALDMLTGLLVHGFKISEKGFYRIMAEVYPEIANK